MEIVKDLFRGAGYIFKGIIFFFRERSLWKYALLPLLITLLFYGLLLWGLFALSGVLSQQLDELCASLPSYLSFLSFLGSTVIYITAMAALLLVVIFCSGSIYELAGGPFFDALLKKQEENFSRKNGSPCVPVPEIPYSFILKNTLSALFYNICTLLLFPVLLLCSFFLPVIGPAISVGIMAYRLFVGYLTIPGFYHGVSFADLKLLARKNKSLVLGAGVILYFLFMIHFAAILLLPGVVCGCAMLFREIRHRAEEQKFTSQN